MTTYWFKQKQFGYGATPAAWQGWLLMLAYLAIVIGCVATVGASQVSPWGLAAAAVIFVAATAVAFRWTYLKTEGGWRWHWGND
jgi:hypothetical protein